MKTICHSHSPILLFLILKYHFIKNWQKISRYNYWAGAAVTSKTVKRRAINEANKIVLYLIMPPIFIMLFKNNIINIEIQQENSVNFNILIF